MKKKIERMLFGGILAGFLSHTSLTAHAGQIWLQVIPGVNNTWHELSKLCPGSTPASLEQYNRVAGASIPLSGVNAVGSVRCVSGATSNSAFNANTNANTVNVNSIVGQEEITDGSVGGEYRSNDRERQVKATVDATFYDCERYTNGDRKCSGPRIYGEGRQSTRKSNGNESGLARVRLGQSYRQYGKNDNGKPTRDTQTLSGELAYRSTGNLKLNAYGEVERKLRITKKTALKGSFTGRVPVATLNGDHRNPAAIGTKGEVQHDVTKNVKAIGSLGAWNSFRNGGTLSATPKVALRYNNTWELGVGKEFVSGGDTTNIVSGKYLFHKRDRKNRQGRHREGDIYTIDTTQLPE